MIRYYKAEGIVLSRRNIGESDKLLSIFTRQFGKKTLLAKGIRKSTSRRAPYLEPFSHTQLVIHHGKWQDLITQVESCTIFSHLRTRLERVSFAYIALELVERLTAENQDAAIIFEKLHGFLQILNDRGTGRKEAVVGLSRFKHFLLAELGFMVSSMDVSGDIDFMIEQVLESRLKSPLLLTNIQMNG